MTKLQALKKKTKHQLVVALPFSLSIVLVALLVNTLVYYIYIYSIPYSSALTLKTCGNVITSQWTMGISMWQTNVSFK